MSYACCKSGFKWDGKPVGHEGTLDKNKAYITGSNKDVAILLIHDVFGWTFPNLRILADHFAEEANATVYLPDFFDGEVLDPDLLTDAYTTGDPEKMRQLDMPSFTGRHSKKIRGPEIFACAKALKAQYKKIGAVGYCYGGWASFQLGAKGNNLVDAVSVAHPSQVTTKEVDALGVPTQILAPEFDQQLTPELKEYCNRIIPGLGIPYRYDYYPGLVHGFAAKGDPNNPKQKEGLERAKNATVSWFNQFLH
ncbi:endo-1,3-1,4-beta-D-glucanase [Mollisia scopiformis]|uniref:Endo-1,3-1,4-beta-D-glucanase n=1 Tax=Mollisia scopiformis TaxID=149040 RepID=A0A132B657_MOLSC|nr:endo-1,3-1,4-beta-D-glucanase [Mollisia scopiformis]KUJ07821.1 endo-1,3-1,4-beta-D-glucanase [Mollisia scopiformis]